MGGVRHPVAPAKGFEPLTPCLQVAESLTLGTVDTYAHALAHTRRASVDGFVPQVTFADDNIRMSLTLRLSAPRSGMKEMTGRHQSGEVPG